MQHTGSGCQEMVIRKCYFLLKMTTPPPRGTVHFSDRADGGPLAGLLVSVSPQDLAVSSLPACFTLGFSVPLTLTLTLNTQ